MVYYDKNESCKQVLSFTIVTDQQSSDECIHTWIIQLF